MELDGLLLDGAGARYEGVDLGEGRDRTAGRELDRDDDRTVGRETFRWEVGLDRLELETEGLDWLRGVRLVTDPLDPDEDREILRLEEEGRDDRWVRVGVRVTLAPDRPLDRELERCRVNVRLDPVRLGRLTLDGREGARTREPPERETEGVDGLRLVCLVTDLLDPDEDREILRLEEEDREDWGVRVGVRMTFTPDRPLDRELDRWRMNDGLDPVRLGRLTLDGREGARTREFPERETEGVDGLRLLRLVTDSLDPDEGRERLRLEVEERAGCEAWVRERLRLSRDAPCCRESDRWRVIVRVDPVRSARLTVDRREAVPTRESPEPLRVTVERREPPSTTRSRVRPVDWDANLEERTPLLEETEFRPLTRGRRSSLGRPSRNLPTMALEATTRVLVGPLPRSRP